MVNPSTASSVRTSDAVTELLRGLAWILMIVMAVPTNADSDLWGNVRFGLDLLRTWHVSTIDPYSFTQDVPWMNHGWLAQIMMAAAYTVGGTTGLVLLKLGLVLLTLVVVRSMFAGTKRLVPEAGCLLVLWAGLPLTGTLRAQLWSFLFLAVLVRLLAAKRPHPVLVPLLIAVWVNSHMGWVIGLATLTWWAIGTVIRESGAPRSRAIALVLLSFLATLINPYGWHLWDFALRVTHLSRGIQEWQPLWTAPAITWIPVILAALATLSALLIRRLPFDRAISLAGLAYASFMVVKFTPFFVELAVLFLAPLAHFKWPARESPLIPSTLRRANQAALAVLAVAAIWTSWPRLHCIRIGDWRPDPTAARALLDAEPVGRMAVWFDWGEYVIWHFGPDLKVSFDPRYDLVYSPAAIEEQRQVALGTPQGVAFLRRIRPEYVWYPRSMAVLRDWVVMNGYRIDVETGESFLAVRSDLSPVRLTGVGPASGCFPGP